MINYSWEGMEPNQIGFHEFHVLCGEVGAEPIIAVNFSSDGRPVCINTVQGKKRAGAAQCGDTWLSGGFPTYFRSDM